MTRFAWLQSRTTILAGAGLLVVLAVAAAITGVELSHLYHSSVVPCRFGCDLVEQQFTNHDHFMNTLLDVIARVAPALIGLFWGVPLLARELESGTYRLAWTQSVTRSRWIVTKLAVGALATVVLSGLLTLAITWWYRSLDPLASNRYMIFDRRDIVPIGYALFAFASGALLGAIIRRSVPAMAATLGTFVFTRIATQLWVRPHLLTPVTHTEPRTAMNFGIEASNGGAPAIVAQANTPANSWALTTHIVNANGTTASLAERTSFVRQYCPAIFNDRPPMPKTGHVLARPVPGQGAAGRCFEQASHSFKVSVSYLPVDRYWTLQWLELAIFVGLAVLCSAGSFWWVTRRTS